MKAWLGTALPFDVPNQSIGDGSPATRYSEQTTSRPTPLKAFFQRLFGTPPPPEPPHELIDRMVSDRTGGSGDFRVGSGPRILAELEAACRRWGLPEDETLSSQRGEELYEEAAENDEQIARCYALMCRSFFRHAIANSYIVWFIK
jgi:hypothetical protein